MKDKIIEILKTSYIDEESDFIETADRILAIQEEEAKKRYEEAKKFLGLNWDGISNQEQVLNQLLHIASGYEPTK